MKQILKNIKVAVIVWLILISLFCILFGKPAHADQMTQYDASTQIYLQDTSSEECAKVNATGTAYALDTVDWNKAYGCWADYGEIYEIQLSPKPKVFLHYWFNKSRFEVK